MFSRLLLLAVVVLGAFDAAAQTPAPLPKVLFFANPMGSDNDVIRRTSPNELSVAERNFAELSKGLFEVTITQNGHEVTAAILKQYDAIVFFTAINPPGVDVLALTEWVKNGGAFTGIHSTANTYQEVPAFGQMLGAYYDRRPWRTRQAPQTKVRVKVENQTHPATKHWGTSFEIADDIYQFKNFDRSKVDLLLSLDPQSLDLANKKVNAKDKDLAVSWAKTQGTGRVFYTALGDWEETWKNPDYRTHLIEGIRWTLKK